MGGRRGERNGVEIRWRMKGGGKGEARRSDEGMMKEMER